MQSVRRSTIVIRVANRNSTHKQPPAQRIEAARAAAGITKKDAAEWASISVAWWNRVTSGESTAPAETVVRMAYAVEDALGDEIADELGIARQTHDWRAGLRRLKLDAELEGLLVAVTEQYLRHHHRPVD